MAIKRARTYSRIGVTWRDTPVKLGMTPFACISERKMPFDGVARQTGEAINQFSLDKATAINSTTNALAAVKRRSCHQSRGHSGHRLKILSRLCERA